MDWLFTFLRERAGVAAPAPTAPVDVAPAERLAMDFVAYLQQGRAPSPSTIRQYVHFARQFLAQRFGNGRINLDELCAADVVGFVQRRAAHRHTRRSQAMTTALRSFLQYARSDATSPPIGELQS